MVGIDLKSVNVLLLLLLPRVVILCIVSCRAISDSHVLIANGNDVEDLANCEELPSTERSTHPHFSRKKKVSPILENNPKSLICLFGLRTR
jgi:hypothetical protein